MAICIMIVDDEPDVVDLFKRRFRREIRKGDYLLVFAQSGEDALQNLKGTTQPEVMLILSDINMPGMSGLELLRESKSLWPDLPVAMITAYGDDENRNEALAAGAAHFLTKPIDFVELKATIAGMAAAGRKD